MPKTHQLLSDLLILVEKNFQNVYNFSETLNPPCCSEQTNNKKVYIYIYITEKPIGQVALWLSYWYHNPESLGSSPGEASELCFFSCNWDSIFDSLTASFLKIWQFWKARPKICGNRHLIPVYTTFLM